MQENEALNPTLWEILKTVVPWIGGAIFVGLGIIGAIVKWGIDKITDRLDKANELLDQAQARMDKAHETEKDALAQQISHWKDLSAERVLAVYKAGEEAWRRTLETKDREIEEKVEELRKAEESGRETAELKRHLEQAERELGEYRSRHQMVTSFLANLGEGEAQEFTAHGLTEVKLGRHLRDPTEFKNYLIYWIGGDNHYFEHVVDGIRRLENDEVQRLHRATLIPLRILERLRDLADAGETVDEKTKESLRKDLIISVYTSQPRPRSASSLSGRKLRPVSVMIGKVNAANGPFVGVQVCLEDGNEITMQLRSGEGWIARSSEEIEIVESPDAPAAFAAQGVGFRFDIP